MRHEFPDRVAQFTGRAPFSLGRFGIVPVVMTMTEEDEVLASGVDRTPVDVGDLTLDDSLRPFEPPTETASAP